MDEAALGRLDQLTGFHLRMANAVLARVVGRTALTQMQFSDWFGCSNRKSILACRSPDDLQLWRRASGCWRQGADDILMGADVARSRAKSNGGN
jgi:hypothetical protein